MDEVRRSQATPNHTGWRAKWDGSLPLELQDILMVNRPTSSPKDLWVLMSRTTALGGTRRQFWTYKNKGLYVLVMRAYKADVDSLKSPEKCGSTYHGRHRPSRPDIILRPLCNISPSCLPPHVSSC